MRTFGILLVCATALFAAACDQLQQVVGPQEYNGASLIVEVDAAAAVERDLESISERMANALRESGISYSGRAPAKALRAFVWPMPLSRQERSKHSRH